MIRRAVVLASMLLAWMPAAAGAHRAERHPARADQSGVAWAGVPGMLPANAQALMYDRLTPLGRNVTAAMLQPSADGSGYFKSAKLLAPGRPVADHRRDDQLRRADARGSGATRTACRTCTPTPTTA